MSAGGFDGQQGACHLVFALRAAFKRGVAVLNAPLQRLVVAGFKMQAIDSGQCAPVAPVCRQILAVRACINCTYSYQTRSNALPLFPFAMFGYEHQPVLRHVGLHAFEKAAAQVRCVAVLVIGALVAAVKKVPVFVGNIFAQRPAKFNARI